MALRDLLAPFRLRPCDVCLISKVYDEVLGMSCKLRSESALVVVSWAPKRLCDKLCAHPCDAKYWAATPCISQFRFSMVVIPSCQMALIHCRFGVLVCRT